MKTPCLVAINGNTDILHIDLCSVCWSLLNCRALEKSTVYTTNELMFFFNNDVMTSKLDVPYLQYQKSLWLISVENQRCTVHVM